MYICGSWCVFLVNLGSTRVSNELGAGRPQAARLAVSVVLLLAISEGVLVGTVVILIRNIWGYAYSNEEEVVRYVAVILPLLAVSNFLDALQSVLSGKSSKKPNMALIFISFRMVFLTIIGLHCCKISGIVRGCGSQKIGAFINLGSYYIFGIPTAILLAFVLHIGGKVSITSSRYIRIHN